MIFRESLCHHSSQAILDLSASRGEEKAEKTHVVYRQFEMFVPTFSICSSISLKTVLREN